MSEKLRLVEKEEGPEGDQEKEDWEQLLRRQTVIDLLDKNPEARMTMRSYQATQDLMRITVAIRHVAVFEMDIPASKYDAWALMELIDKHGGGDGGTA